MYIMNCAFFNAYCVYNMLSTKKIKYKNFVYVVGHAWALKTVQGQRMDESDPVTSSSTSRHVSRSHHPLRLSGDLKKHKIEKILITGKKYPTRICKLRSSHKIKCYTSYTCGYCNIAIHKGDCFELFIIF